MDRHGDTDVPWEFRNKGVDAIGSLITESCISIRIGVLLMLTGVAGIL